MRSVSSRTAAVALFVLVLATPALAARAGADSGLCAQFEAWLDAQIGISVGATGDSPTIQEWLVLMARIGVPIG